jgi:hypothetical protein
MMEAHYVHKRVSRTYGVAALCNVHEPWALSDTNSELTCPNCLKALVASETRGATMTFTCPSYLSPVRGLALKGLPVAPM